MSRLLRTRFKPKGGINLSFLSYFNTGRPLQNLFRMTDAELTSTYAAVAPYWANGPSLTYDANGYPTNMETSSNNHQAIGIIQMNAADPAGTVYRITWNGPTDGLSVDGATNTGPNERSYTRSGTAETNMLIRILKNGVSDVVVHRASEPFSGGKFRTEFLNRMKQVAVIRFMDWARTNVGTTTWANRTTETHRSQGNATKGVSWEWMIDLCNETGCGGWFCLPHTCDDAYVTSWANLVLSRRVGNWPVYLEYSNETWNSLFPQYSYVAAQAPENHFYTYTVRRCREVGVLARATGLKINLVLGLQSAANSDHQWYLKNRTPDGPLDLTGVDCLAFAPYFGGTAHIAPNSTNITSGGVPTALSYCQTHMDTDVAGWIDGNVEIAQYRGKRCIFYEGGPHMQVNGNTTLTNIFIATNRDAGMYTLMQNYLNLLTRKSNGELICLFNDTWKPQESGQWGLQEYEGESSVTAHKFRAWRDWLAANGQ